MNSSCAGFIGLVTRLPAARVRPTRDLALLGRRPRTLFAMIAVLLSLSNMSRGQGFEKAVLDRVKDATVYIKVKQGPGGWTGSGFVMNVTGDTMLIMTNRHVAVPDLEAYFEKNIKPEITVVFRSGMPNEQSVPAKLIGFDAREYHDLAVIEVKGFRSPPTSIPANMTAAESEFYETMPAYALGFPLGAKMQFFAGDFKANPAMTVNSLTISSLRRDENKKLNRVQLAGSLIGGNSGGPVVDAKGRLVGVVVERVPGESVGFAVPPTMIADFLAGGVDEIKGLLETWTGTTATIRIRGHLVDPFGKIRSMALRYAKQPSTPSPMKTDSNGKWPLLEGGTEVPLAIADGFGFATIQVAAPTLDDRKLLLQVVLKDSFGRLVTCEVHPVSISYNRTGPGAIKGMDAEASTPRTASHWSCETNLSEGIKMTHKPGTTIIDLPAGVPINNAPQYNLFNAPCALVKVDGDFVATVGVGNTFDPGGEGVVLSSGKKLPFSFQSAGILIWQDEKNFIRVERSKGSESNNSPLVNRLLCEVYKNGKESAIRYIDIPEQPTMILVRRKGGSLHLLYALLPRGTTDFQNLSIDFSGFSEFPLDFKSELLVGVAAANLSKRPFHARLEGFTLVDLQGEPIQVKPFKLAKLVDSGVEKLPDGTRILEGAGLKVVTGNAQVAPQTMADYKGEWSDNRQLLWSNDKSGQALSLELPVDADGRYEIKGKFTLAPDYAIARLDIEGKPLYKGEKIDFYAQETRPTALMSLGTLSMNKGKRKLTITVFGKNAKSAGYKVGLDEIQLKPVTK